MKTFNVTLSATYTVNAMDEDEAIEKAFDKAEVSDLDVWNDVEEIEYDPEFDDFDIEMGKRERAERLGISEDVFNEIDFMLGSIDECSSEYLLPILQKHGIDPHGGFLYMEQVPDDVIKDINETLFVTGILEPFVYVG